MRLLYLSGESTPGVRVGANTGPEHPRPPGLRERPCAGDRQVQRFTACGPLGPPGQLTIRLVTAALAQELHCDVPPRRGHPAQVGRGQPRHIYRVIEVRLDLSRKDERDEKAAGAFGSPPARPPQWMSTRSTTKMSVSPGPIAEPAPRSP